MVELFWCSGGSVWLGGRFGRRSRYASLKFKDLVEFTGYKLDVAPDRALPDKPLYRFPKKKRNNNRFFFYILFFSSTTARIVVCGS